MIVALLLLMVMLMMLMLTLMMLMLMHDKAKGALRRSIQYRLFSTAIFAARLFSTGSLLSRRSLFAARLCSALLLCFFVGLAPRLCWPALQDEDI